MLVNQTPCTVDPSPLISVSGIVVGGVEVELLAVLTVLDVVSERLEVVTLAAGVMVTAPQSGRDPSVDEAADVVDAE